MKRQGDDSTGDSGANDLLAPAELSTLEVEPHARAAERQDTENAVDARRIRVGRGVEHESGQRVPALVAQRYLAELESPQVSRTRCVTGPPFRLSRAQAAAQLACVT